MLRDCFHLQRSSWAHSPPGRSRGSWLSTSRHFACQGLPFCRPSWRLGRPPCAGSSRTWVGNRFKITVLISIWSYNLVIKSSWSAVTWNLQCNDYLHWFWCWRRQQWRGRGRSYIWWSRAWLSFEWCRDRRTWLGFTAGFPSAPRPF